MLINLIFDHMMSSVTAQRTHPPYSLILIIPFFNIGGARSFINEGMMTEVWQYNKRFRVGLRC